MKPLSPIIAICIVILAAATAIGLCSARANEMPHEGLPLGDRQFVSYHHGFNAWIGLAVPVGQGVLICNQSSAEVQAELAAAKQYNQTWGEPDYWLRLPECSVSLWWLLLPYGSVIVMTLLGFFNNRAGLPDVSSIARPATLPSIDYASPPTSQLRTLLVVSYFSTSSPRNYSYPKSYIWFKRVIAMVGLGTLTLPLLPLIAPSIYDDLFYWVILPIIIESSLLMLAAIVKACFAFDRHQWLLRKMTEDVRNTDMQGENAIESAS